MPTPSIAGAKSNFVRFNLTTSEIHYFTQSISMALGSQFQLTPNTLVSSEQIAYGGSAFGQGFIPNIISGDNGAFGESAGVGVNVTLINHLEVGLTLAKPLKVTQTTGVGMGWQGFFNVTGTL